MLLAYIVLILTVSSVNSQSFIERYSDLLNVSLPNFRSDEDAGILSNPAFLMIDASSKIPNFLNFYDLGNFDECYRIKTDDYYGKYCIGPVKINISLPSQSYNIRRVPALHPEPRHYEGNSGIPDHLMAVCFPSTWSLEFMNQYALINLTEEQCYSQEKTDKEELTGGAIGTISFFAIIVAVAVMQTFYDVYLYYAQQKPKHELLVAFSCLSNGKKLIAASTNPDQLLCLNGIRALSMLWVVVGHVFTSINGGPLFNIMDVSDWMAEVGNMYIIGATVAVDTFFMLGGLVTVYTFLKATDKGVKFNIFMYYIHRYLRLTPAFGAVILIQRNLLSYIGKAPFWYQMKSMEVDTCKDNWWRNILYIDNFFPVMSNCLGQGWYLNVDMQLFVLSPLVLLPLSRWRKQTLYGIYFLTLVGIIIPFSIIYSEDIGSMVQGDIKFMHDYYSQPHTRFSPYVIGMAFGYYIYELKQKKEKIPTFSKFWVCVAWLCSLTVMVACVYAGHSVMASMNPNILDNAFYQALNRPAWAAAIGVMVYLCVSGNGGPIDYFLSMHLFQFITKLSYSIYLLHYAIVNSRYNLAKTPIYFSPWNLFHMFWGDFMFSLILAVPFCLLFESPIIILEKYLFRTHKKK